MKTTKREEGGQGHVQFDEGKSVLPFLAGADGTQSRETLSSRGTARADSPAHSCAPRSPARHLAASLLSLRCSDLGHQSQAARGQQAAGSRTKNGETSLRRFLRALHSFSLSLSVLKHEDGGSVIHSFFFFFFPHFIIQLMKTQFRPREIIIQTCGRGGAGNEE